MAANGKVLTGFSQPWVALYAAANGVVTYTSGMALARGVNVSISPDDVNDDNIFYADNGPAETDPGVFAGGDLTLTVDGLLETAKRLVMGLPAAESLSVGGETVGVTHYGDSQAIPYVGVGFLCRWMSDGVVTYTATVLNKCKFNQIDTSAETQEAEIDWQTQEITGRVLRCENANHDWKMETEDVADEASALAALKTMLGVA